MKRAFIITWLIIGLFFMVASPSLAKKDTLIVAVKIKITSLDLVESTTRQTLILCHNWGDTLVYRDPVKKKIVPCLAESYQFIDANTIEFKLRKGIRFHNGEPFNAQVVKFSMDILRHPDAVTKKYFIKFKEVIVVDEYTVRIVSSIPTLTSLEIIANMLFIYPPKYYKEVGNKGFGRHPIGTGPYKFVAWKTPREILFRANPDYHGPPKGKARIPNLKIISVPEQMLRIEALITGQVDLIRGGVVAPEQLMFLESNHDIKIRTVKKLREFFIVFDALDRSGTGYFKDRRVRRAVNHAINKKEIINKILMGYNDICNSVTNHLHFGHEPYVTVYAYDPARAKRLLTEAGYPDGFSVDFYAFGYETVAEAIVLYLNNVGIKANMKWTGGKWDTLYKRLLSGKAPIAFINWGSYSIFDAGAIMNRFFMMDDPLCQGSTPLIHRMLKEADRVSSQEKRRILFSKSQKIIAEEAFWVPLYCGNSIAVMKKALNFEPCYDEVDRYFTASWVN